jgi:hypothetical protein
MAKLKLTIAVVFDAHKEDYGCSDPEEMAALEEGYIRDGKIDLEHYLYHGATSLSYSVKAIEEDQKNERA